MLHTLSSSTINLQLIAKTDIVIFWQNGVEITIYGNPLLEEILKRTENCYSLDNDVTARGITSYIDSRVKIITMQKLIEFTALYHPQINW